MMPFLRHTNLQTPSPYTDDLQTRILEARKQNLAYKKVLAESILQKEKRYQSITLLDRNNSEFSQRIPESNKVQRLTEAVTRNVNQVPDTPIHMQKMPNNSPPLATSTSVPRSNLYDTVELPIEITTNNNNNEKSDLQRERKKKKIRHHKSNKSKQRSMQSEKNASTDKQLSASLITIINTLQVTIDDNTTSLNASLITKNQNNHKSQPAKDNDIELARKEDLRNKIKSFLEKNKDEEKELPMPLWRHILKGNHSPSTSSILKPKAILRSIIWSVVLLVTHPFLTYTKKKLISKESEQSALASTLLLYQEACTQWLGKLVRVPMLSIQSDDSLDFHIHLPDHHHHSYFTSFLPASSSTTGSEGYPYYYYYEGRKRLSMREKLLQLKVRVKCIIKAVTSSDPRASTMELNNNNNNNSKLLASESVTVDASLPPAHIIDFLASLAEDGNFYASDFLYDFEKLHLEFDRFGAVTGMLPVVTKSDSATAAAENNLPSTQSPEPSPLPPPSVIGKPQVITVNEQCLDVRRFRLLLQDFLLVRILLDNVLLHPWHFGLCPFPSSHSGSGAATPHKYNTLYNYRIVASILYEIFLRADPQLPLVHHERAERNAVSVANIGEKRLSIPPANTVKTRLSVTTKSEPRLSATFKKSALGQSVMGVDVTSNARKDALRNIAAIDNMSSNSNSNSKSTNATGSNPMVWLGRFIGMSRNIATTDTTDNNNNTTYYEELCSRMLDAKETPFSTLQDIHNLLFDFNSLVHAKFYMESWIDELAVDVRNWIDRIVLHTLLVRLEKKKKISAAQV